MGKGKIICRVKLKKTEVETEVSEKEEVVVATEAEEAVVVTEVAVAVDQEADQWEEEDKKKSGSQPQN